MTELTEHPELLQGDALTESLKARAEEITYFEPRQGKAFLVADSFKPGTLWRHARLGVLYAQGDNGIVYGNFLDDKGNRQSVAFSELEPAVVFDGVVPAGYVLRAVPQPIEAGMWVRTEGGTEWYVHDRFPNGGAVLFADADGWSGFVFTSSGMEHVVACDPPHHADELHAWLAGDDG